jgi:hypothetical protein
MLSLFELFKIGIGPSSSHTVGPMIAAGRFVRRLEADSMLGEVESVEVDLFGSLALTGKGHARTETVSACSRSDRTNQVATAFRRRCYGSIRSAKDDCIPFPRGSSLPPQWHAFHRSDLRRPVDQ